MWPASSNWSWRSVCGAGLNVVMGDVGTGKTTLCRQLILRFTESEEDCNEFETHLILDPNFSTPREFLSAVAMTFGLPGAETAESEWQLKENIKKYLFQKGVDEKKTVVLIIDEGQKIPYFCREILREFLNYETNENKLLQIILFAQNEFAEILKSHGNFADRVNQYYFSQTPQLQRNEGIDPLQAFPGGPAGGHAGPLHPPRSVGDIQGLRRLPA